MGRRSWAWITAWSDGEGETLSPVGDKASSLLDGRGRVARKTFQPGAASVPGLSQVEQRFDARDQLLEAIEQSGAGSVTTRFEYDARWRLQQTTRGAECSVPRFRRGIAPSSGRGLRSSARRAARIAGLSTTVGPAVNYVRRRGN